MISSKKHPQAVIVVDANGIPVNFGNMVIPSGTTAERPTTPVAGQQYFDTDLGKPIWYSGANWVDSTGATV